ncbi:hypothetical protein M407DRAFT_44826, partial [Tulasnella calospora MUT 4182]
CLPGTRLDILEQIDGWVRDPSAPKRTLWVCGMAGRGKSTIASTVAHAWRFRASCAIFHFRRGQDALNIRVVCALARQLGGSLVPEVRNAVLDSIRENEDIANQRLGEQFKTLLVASLGKLNGHTYPILIIVDGLDECQNPKDVKDFVKLIHQHSSSFPSNVRFLLTCRPDAALYRARESNGWDAVDLDSAPEVSKDLALFIDRACTKIRDDHRLPESWPAAEDLARLVDMSQGLFQWARTAATYISNGSPVNRLRGLLQRQAMWSGLDDLYHQILSKAIHNASKEPEKQELVRSLLGTLVVAPHAISLEVVATLYADSETFEGMEQEDIIQFIREDILVDLYSLLHIPTSAAEPLRFMHTSIRDLLVSKQRCQDQAYHIDTVQYHQQLANLSLGVMLNLLKENICKLSDLSKPISEIQDVAEGKVPKVLRYCCQAWSIHLTEGLQWPGLDKDATRSQLAAFELFSKERILGWMEVMSVIGATSEAIRMAKQVHRWLLSSPSERFESLSPVNLWNDVHRFIAAFFEPISFGPLHIYASALPHCPKKTELWRLYSSSAKVRIQGGRQMPTWPSNLWTRSADGSPKDIAFSADGTLVISGSDNGKIQVWDTETGSQTGETLSTGIDLVHTVCISPGGRLMASGSWDKPIRLWDTQTGRQLTLDGPLTGRNEALRCSCFSPDGRVLAVGLRIKSSDGTIRLWDTQTGRQLGELLTSHEEAIQCSCFSPDGRVLAVGLSTGLSHGIIRLWDTQIRKQLGEPLAHHNGSASSICFSPDGRLLASTSGCHYIRLWDTQTGRQLGTASWDGLIKCICFSPQGTTLAAAFGATIRLWDTQTVRQLGEPLDGHTGTVQCLCFSPDGRVLASGSYDKTIRLWDTQTGRQLGEPQNSHGNWISSVCVSPDGRTLAFRSSDDTIRLWDTRTRRQLGEPLTGHGDDVSCICLSPSGILLVSESDYSTQLLDTKSGRKLGEPLTSHPDCFSPDGRLLAIPCGRRILLWDTQTGKEPGELLAGHTYSVESVCFSRDARLLASTSEDNKIRLWDTQTGRQLGKPLTGHTKSVFSVCFSPDVRLLASTSNDKTIRLWDTQTGRQLGEPLTCHGDGFQSVGFSPDGMFLVGHETTGASNIWDVRT